MRMRSTLMQWALRPLRLDPPPLKARLTLQRTSPLLLLLPLLLLFLLPVVKSARTRSLRMLPLGDLTALKGSRPAPHPWCRPETSTPLSPHSKPPWGCSGTGLESRGQGPATPTRGAGCISSAVPKFTSLLYFSSLINCIMLICV